MITPKQRADTLRAALEAHFGVSLPGAEWMIEQTIIAAAPSLSIGTMRLRMCPVSERPCGMPGVCEANENGCVNRHPCPHNVTTLAGMVTRCNLCGEVIP